MYFTLNLFIPFLHHLSPHHVRVIKQLSKYKQNIQSCRYPSGSSSLLQVILTGWPDLADSSQASAIFDTAAVILPVTDIDALFCTTSRKWSNSLTYPSLCLKKQNIADFIQGDYNMHLEGKE